jgi:hypothetical protein
MSSENDQTRTTTINRGDNVTEKDISLLEDKRTAAQQAILRH